MGSRWSFTTFCKELFAVAGLFLVVGFNFSANADALMLSIGVGRVDPAHYGTNVATLTGPEHDAIDARSFIANWPTNQPKKSFGLLLNEKATRTNVIGILDDVATRLNSNDLFVVYFSGHGGEIPDPHADATNGMDQTWCLFDGELLDKELYAEWAKFPAGVRIVLISDSCHSAGISKLAFDAADQIVNAINADVLDDAKFNVGGDVRSSIRAAENSRLEFQDTEHCNVKSLAPQDALLVYSKNRDFYRELLANLQFTNAPIQTKVLSISACGDNQFAADAGVFRNSIFTRALLSCWKGGAYKGSYVLFVKSVRTLASAMNSDQTVAARMIDTNDPAFWHQRPFTFLPPNP
jgi:hypothetical protein